MFLGLEGQHNLAQGSVHNAVTALRTQALGTPRPRGGKALIRATENARGFPKRHRTQHNLRGPARFYVALTRALPISTRPTQGLRRLPLRGRRRRPGLKYVGLPGRETATIIAAMKRRLRFSLQTLLLSVLLAGSAVALWLHWEPWVLQATIEHGGKNVDFAFFAQDDSRVVWGATIIGADDARTDEIHVSDADTGVGISYHRNIKYFVTHTVGILAGRPVAITGGDDNGPSLVDAWKHEFRKTHAARVTLRLDDCTLDDAIERVVRAMNAHVMFAPGLSGERLSRRVIEIVKDENPLAVLERILKRYDLSLLFIKDDTLIVVDSDEYNTQRRSDLGNNPRVWNLATGELIATLRGSASQISALACSPDGMYVFGGCVDGTGHLWDASGQRHLLQFTTRDCAISAAMLSAGGDRVALSFSDNTTGAWKCGNGEQLALFSCKDNCGVYIAANGARAAFLDYNHVRCLISLWDLDRKAELRRNEFDEEQTINFSLSPNGQRVISHFGHECGALMDTSTGNPLARFEFFRAQAQFSKQGDIFALTLGEITLFDAESGMRLANLPKHNRRLEDLWTAPPIFELHLADPFGPQPPRSSPPHFSADGRHIIAAMSSEELGIWSRRRPERWWGLAWLPEFWLTLVLVVLLLANIVRNWRRARGLNLTSLAVCCRPGGERL